MLSSCLHDYVQQHVPTSAAFSVSATTASQAASIFTRYFWSCSKCQSEPDKHEVEMKISTPQAHSAFQRLSEVVFKEKFD